MESEALAGPREYLVSYRNRGLDLVPDGVWKTLRDIKGQAIRAGDQTLAKAVWCLETVGRIQDHYLSAFASLRAGNYYEGWCELERCEIELHFVDDHYHDDKGAFGLEFIGTHVKRYQGLFPYAVFLSPAFLKEEMRCSVCDARVYLRNPCGHRVGEIYDGEMCGRAITKAKLLEVSIVDKPAQKYSVPFLGGGEARDHYDYTLVRFVAERLRSPWDEWESHWTYARHPHERYRHVGRNEPCPCGSGKKYKKCCLNEAGVLRPHCEIEFHVSPPLELPMFGYSTTP